MNTFSPFNRITVEHNGESVTRAHSQQSWRCADTRVNRPTPSDLTVDVALRVLDKHPDTRISIADTGTNLTTLAQRVTHPDNTIRYQQIIRFHSTEDFVTNVAGAAKLYQLMNLICRASDEPCLDYWRCGGAMTVSDSIENIVGATLDAVAFAAMSGAGFAFKVEATGGTVSATDLMYVIEAYAVVFKPGAHVSVTHSADVLSASQVRCLEHAFMQPGTMVQWLETASSNESTTSAPTCR